MIRKTAACAALALALAGCEGGRGLDGSTVGTVGGAGAGALLGSQIGSGTGRLAATAIGTLVGAFAGREVGRYMDRDDEDRAAAAERRAIAQNEPVSWNNAKGYRGSVDPQRTYTNTNGQVCRDYTHTVVIEGRTETARGTACRLNDGTWQLVG